jgi:septal ring factor EnvC (AmiA/AmiB activator)
MASRSSTDRRISAFVLPLILGGAIAAQAPSPAPAPGTKDPDQLRALHQRATERLASLQREADSLARQQRGLLDRMRALEVQRAAAVAAVTKADAELALATTDLERVSASLAETTARIEARRPRIHARAAALYTTGAPEPWRWWLGAEDLLETARASQLLAAIAERDQREFAEFRTLRADLARQRAETERRTAECRLLSAAALDAKAAADGAAAAHDALIREVDARRDLTAQLASELETARQRLQKELGELGAAPAAAPALPIKSFRGSLPWPAAGRLVTGYGRRSSTRFGTMVARNGVEIGAPAATPVQAIHEGRVAFADTFAGFGRLVIVDHGSSVFSLYGYLEEVAVTRGARVERGTPVGTSGRGPDGRETVYFELRVDGRPVNPIEWLKR